MSYTPPAGDALVISWVGEPAYAPPAGDALVFDFAAGQPLVARAAAPSPLGAPAVLAASVRAAWAGAPTMLGSPVVLGQAFELMQVRAAAPSMLGEPAVLGTAGNSYLGWAAAPSPLGAPAAVARPVLAGWVALPGPLGAAAVLAQQPVHGRVAVPGVLGAPLVLAQAAEPPTFATVFFTEFDAAGAPIGQVDSEFPGITSVNIYPGTAFVDAGILKVSGEQYLDVELPTYPAAAGPEYDIEMVVRARTDGSLVSANVYIEAFDDLGKRIRTQALLSGHWRSDNAEYHEVLIRTDDSSDVYEIGYLEVPAGPSVWNDYEPHTLRMEVRLGRIRTYEDGVLKVDMDLTGKTAIQLTPSNVYLYTEWLDIDSVSMVAVNPGEIEPPNTAAGFTTTAFGAPYGANAYRATTIGELPRFGTPATPTYTEHLAQGFNNTRFGVPYGLLPFEFEPANQAASARGWLATQFGTPAGQSNFAGQAQGWQAAQFGSPRYTGVLTAESLGMRAQFGTPTAGSGHRAQGFRATQFGTPTCAVGYLAQGFGRTRFGTPRASLPGVLVARGWCGTRFGTPRGSLPPPGHAATGFSTTQFGVPVATIRHRAATMGPLSRFGRPTLRRNPTC